MNHSIYDDLKRYKKEISVTGLGYVGLPLALEFARHFSVIGFDLKGIFSTERSSDMTYWTL